MNTSAKPDTRPADPRFSSGPCTKRPGWSLDALSDVFAGRSHRAQPGKAKLARVIEQSRTVLGIPEDYRLGIVPASDTGAVEMALWSLLGLRGVDVLAWESFGAGWASDITKQLKIPDVRILNAPYGALPDLAQVDFSNDVVFTWNGTTSGVRVPDGDWIAKAREGLTLCDATSAVFAYDLPWDKLDVVTWSWQKVMGGEAAHGMLALSPRAVERLDAYTPPWPLPKVFRLTKGGKLIEGIFKGATINSPSMLAVEDALDGLDWAQSIGGLKALIGRSQANFQAIEAWVEKSDWADFLAADPATRSTTSVCLAVTDPWFAELDGDSKTKAAKRLAAILDDEGAAFDIGSYRDAPPGLRIWAGATVETQNLEALFPWLDWAYGRVKAEFS
ncbi:MAG TPA: phosphoserine transaminase [Rhodospirillales bacterium]|nr:phosphoserine transaminase [Rhodospirillales bacterium]